MVKLRCHLRTILLIAIGLSWFSGAMADLSDGLVAYYPFDGNANDESGNGHHGTVDGATLTEDRLGNADSAYNFDGQGDLIALGEANIIGSDNDSFSISLWVNLNQGVDEGARNGDFLLRLKQDTEFFIVFYKPTGQSQLYIYPVFRGATQWGVPVNETDYIGQWNHMTVIYNGEDKSTATSYELYLNGIKLPAGTTNFGTAGGIQNNTNVFGADMVADVTANALNGSLDDIRIYNRALSKSEIQQLYQPCQPTIDIKLNSNNRVTGDKVVINTQIKGAGSSDSSCEQTKVEQKVWVKLPNDTVISLIDPYTVLTLLPGDDIETKIFEYTFSGAEPIGAYQIGGRLLHPFSGDAISTDIEVLTFSQ
ncbi:hypothetical protein PN36_28015 [Candidatus Thiomargarita nelsonii]|uniref:LamG-like jellyroll fold domain-containing protein n=1 Tax=Candidatus Thiomargarita nelsonii TaxID=1003181 RepID=A0A4E0QSI9_9GAMM|nr:hypothetical protein PN36_28015 [Candidatus Thiomargarita nelsonii]